MQLNDEIRKIEIFESKFQGTPRSQWYGMGYWLKEYLDVPKFLPLFVHMDHGVPIQDEPLKSDSATKLPLFFVRRSRKDKFEERYGKKSFVVGSSFVHYRRLRQVERDPEAKGTVAFPTHSSHLIDVVSDWCSYADALLGLPSHFHPVTVCLYWKDLVNGAHRPLLEKKIPVVTAGHMADPSFVVNFYNILRKHSYSTSNMMGSYTFYSIEMDIPFFLYGENPRFNNWGGDPNRPQGTYELDARSADEMEFRDYFLFDSSKPISIPVSIHQKCLEKLGLDGPIDRGELRRAIYTALLTHGPERLLAKIWRGLRGLSSDVRVDDLIETKR